MAEDEEAAQLTAAALAYVCPRVAEIRNALRTGPGGDDTVLDRLLDAFRDGADLTDLLDLLHGLLQAGGNALGLYGRFDHGAGTRALRPAGIDVSLTALSDIVYVCPVSRCSRYEWPQTAPSVPRCQFSEDRHLLRERL
jgi:hypothetical protein